MPNPNTIAAELSVYAPLIVFFSVCDAHALGNESVGVAILAYSYSSTQVLRV